jgi:hypothetical protein
LTQAYELGRKAAAGGVGVLELAVLHHEAILHLPPCVAAERSPIVLAREFFAESLSPFEVSLRAYQANARLLGLSEALSTQNAEIDRAREQLRTILDATTAVIYLKDSAGRYLFVNRQFQEVFAVARERVIGRTDEEALPAPVARLFRASDQMVLSGVTPRELEETIPGADGVHTYLSLKFPLRDAGGTPYAVCCVATDITERKRAADALRHAIAAAEQANRELEAFSYSVAHDLRAPLRSIDGFSQALLEDYAERLDEEGRQYLRYVRESAQHMAQLIDDLLALSRVTRSELRRERVDLSGLARAVLAQLQRTQPDRRVRLVIADGLSAAGDARLLRVAFENLLGNAWKFTGRRAEALIEFGLNGDAGEPIYFVRDNGAGFDMAYADKLFGVFQRLHSSADYEGTGIGLATVQRIVSRHGGRIWAEAEVDRGATFRFTLGEAASPRIEPCP